MRGSLLLPFSYSHFLLTIERKAVTAAYPLFPLIRASKGAASSSLLYSLIEYRIGFCFPLRSSSYLADPPVHTINESSFTLPAGNPLLSLLKQSPISRSLLYSQAIVNSLFRLATLLINKIIALEL